MDIEDHAALVHLALPEPRMSLSDVRVMMVTMGCGHNAAESDVIASLLQSAGATIVVSNGRYVTPETRQEADVLYINSCTVKNPSEDRAFVHVRKGLDAGMVVVLGGCVPQSHGALEKGLRNASASRQLIVSGVLTQQWLSVLPEVLREAVDMHIKGIAHAVKPGLRLAAPSSKAAASAAVTYVTREATKTTEIEYLRCTPTFRANPLVDIIATGSGCMGSCTYCKTCHSRGRLRSLPLDTILARVRSSLADPTIRELWLTGEDTLAWGRDSGGTFVELLQAVQKVLETENPTHKMLKIGMTDPDSVIGHEDALISFLCCEYVYKFLHLPIQSGSDHVLQMMRRHYGVATFLASCSKLQASVEDLCLDTDIICGFPGETDEDHAQTLDLFRNLSPVAPRFQVVNITQYYARKNTPAASMVQVPASVKRDRTREMTEIVKGSFNRGKYIGQVHDMLIFERLGNESHGRKYGGKIYNNITVAVESGESAANGASGSGASLGIGTYIRVRISGATQVALIGSILLVHEGPVVVRRVSES